MPKLWGSLSSWIWLWSSTKNSSGPRLWLRQNVQSVRTEGNFVEGLQNSVCQSMLSLWSSNKQATGKDLAQHTSSLNSLQNVSHLGEGKCNSEKQKIYLNSKRSQESTAMYLNIEGTLTPTITCTTYVPIPALWWWSNTSDITKAQSREGRPPTTPRSHFLQISSSIFA